MTEQDFDIIEMYLHGRLSGDEKNEFEQRVKNDPELRSSLAQMRATVIALRQSALDEKAALLKEEEKKLVSSESVSFRIAPLYQMIAVAAILLISVFFLLPLFKPDDTIKNPYLAEHFDEFVLHETTRGNNPDTKVTPEQERAYNLYRMQKFHKAMPLLDKLWEEKRDTLALFYATISKTVLGLPIKEDQGNPVEFGNSRLDSLYNLVLKNQE